MYYGEGIMGEDRAIVRPALIRVRISHKPPSRTHSSVGIVTELRVGRSEAQIPVGSRYFSRFSNVHSGFEDQPTLYSMGTGFFPLGEGLRWPEHEFDHSLPSSAEGKNEWRHRSVPPLRFHGVARSIFTL